MVLEDESDSIALIRLDGRSRSATVEAPKIYGSARNDHLLHGLRNQMKHFHSVVHGERQVCNIWCQNADWRLRIRLCYCRSRQYRRAGSQSKNTSEETSS